MEATHRAALLFDSARTRAKVGARSGICVDRTVLFKSAELTVDVVVHASRAPLRYLHGQVVDESEGRPVRGAFVRIDDGEVPVATDEHGQFALSSLTDQDRYVLRIQISTGEVVCEIPLPDGVSESHADSS